MINLRERCTNFILALTVVFSVFTFEPVKADKIDEMRRFSTRAVCVGVLMYLAAGAVNSSKTDYNVLQRQLIDAYRTGDVVQVQRFDAELKQRDAHWDLFPFLERAGVVLAVGGSLLPYLRSKKESPDGSESKGEGTKKE